MTRVNSDQQSFVIILGLSTTICVFAISLDSRDRGEFFTPFPVEVNMHQATSESGARVRPKKKATHVLTGIPGRWFQQQFPVYVQICVIPTSPLNPPAQRQFSSVSPDEHRQTINHVQSDARFFRELFRADSNGCASFCRPLGDQFDN